MKTTIDLELTVNDKHHRTGVRADELLIDFLHEELGLTGTKFGCGIGACGACKVVLQEKEGGEMLPVLACFARLRAVNGMRVTTVEGIAQGDRLHPLQQAFQERHAFQCGYSTPGMLMTGIALIDRLKRRRGIPRDMLNREINAALSGQVCRCTGYTRYFAALRDVIEHWHEIPGHEAEVLVRDEPQPAVTPAPRVWFRVQKRSRNDLRYKWFEGHFESPRAGLTFARPMQWDTCRGSVTVQVADLRTGEPIRDFNLRKFLLWKIDELRFELKRVRVMEPEVPLEVLPWGSKFFLEVEGGLHLGDARADVAAEVTAVVLSENQMQISTRAPVRVSLERLGLPLLEFAEEFHLDLGAELELGVDDLVVPYSVA